MSRFDGDRLEDITAAIEAIRSHLLRGDLDDILVLDAVRVRLIEIGEAVKALSTDLTATEPDIPWRQIARMRDHLAHRYFATEVEVIRSTVASDLSELEASVQRMSHGWTTDRVAAERASPLVIPTSSIRHDGASLSAARARVRLTAVDAWLCIESARRSPGNAVGPEIVAPHQVSP